MLFQSLNTNFLTLQLAVGRRCSTYRFVRRRQFRYGILRAETIIGHIVVVWTTNDWQPDICGSR